MEQFIINDYSIIPILHLPLFQFPSRTPIRKLSEIVTDVFGDFPKFWHEWTRPTEYD